MWYKNCWQSLSLISLKRLCQSLCKSYFHSMVEPTIIYAWIFWLSSDDKLCSFIITYINCCNLHDFHNIRGLFFFFKVRSVAKLEPQWESDEALRNVSSVPVDVTHHTCQFWASNEPINKPKQWSLPPNVECVLYFDFFIQNKWRGMLSSGTVLF